MLHSDMLEWLNFALAAVALLVSGYLARLRYQETQAKPDLRLYMDWLVGGGPTILRIIAENRGNARGGVRDIVLSEHQRYAPHTSYAFRAHLDELPVMLDAGSIARFPIELDPNVQKNFTRNLMDGVFKYAILIDQDGMRRSFPIPPKPDDTGNRVSLVARVRKC